MKRSIRWGGSGAILLLLVLLAQAAGGLLAGGSQTGKAVSWGPGGSKIGDPTTSPLPSPAPAPDVTFPPPSSPPVPAAAASASEWGQVGCGPEHANFNSNEIVLSPTTIAGLQSGWTHSDGQLSMSWCPPPPVVSGGVLYYNYGDTGSFTA